MNDSPTNVVEPVVPAPAAPQPSVVSSPVTSPSGSLPSIETLFSDSWATLKKSLKQLVIFSLIMLGISLLFGLVLFFIALVLLGGGILSASHGNFNPSAFTVPIGILVLLLILFVIVISAAIQAGSILIINEPGSQPVEEVLKKCIHFIWPLFVLGILNIFLEIPPFFLFIIPGILVVFFLYFSTYELVLGNKGVLDSLRRSAYLVKSHFGGMFLRALVMGGVFILVSIVFGIISLFTVNLPLVNFVISMVRLVVNLMLGWYLLSYSVTLYKQAESAAPDKEKGVKLIWFVVLSAVSLVLVGFVTYSVVKAINSNPEIKDAFTQGFSQGLKTSSANPSSSSSTDFMKQGYKTEFVKSCEQGGASAASCTCIADYMINKYSTNELLQISQQYSQTKQIPQELTAAAQSCVSSR